MNKPQLSAENPQDAFTTEQAYQEYEQFVEMIKREGSMNTPCKKCNELNKPCCDEHSGKIAEPQLTAEMEKRFNKIMLEWIESQWKIEQAHQNGEPYTRMKFEADANKVEKKLKHFIDTAIADERNKVIEEVRELIAYSSFEMTPGGRPMKRTCSVEEAMRQLEKDVAKLNQLKGSDE